MRDGNGLLLAPGGVILERYQRNPVVLYEHSSVIGRCVAVHKSPELLSADIEYDLESQLGAEVYRLHRSGFMPAASVGSIPILFDSTKDGINCQEWELVEISKVGIPADKFAVN